MWTVLLPPSLCYRVVQKLRASADRNIEHLFCSSHEQFIEGSPAFRLLLLLHMNSHFLPTGRKTSVVRTSAGAKRCNGGQIIFASWWSKLRFAASKILHFWLGREERHCMMWTAALELSTLALNRRKKHELCLKSRLEISGLLQGHFSFIFESFL